MNYIELHLFRIKFIRPKQRTLFHDDRTPSELFQAAIQEKPSVELREDYLWHIGNINIIDKTGGSFAVGKTTRKAVGKYDAQEGNFIEEFFEEGAYTYCVYDCEIGILAIAKKTKLAPTTKGIAFKLKKLLESTESVEKNGIDLKIDIISDPESFIQKLVASYSLKQFTAHFTGPNPIDADELFQKPLSVYCQAIGGNKGKVVVEGESLEPEMAIEITKSAASTANEASARIIERYGERPKTIHLKGNPVKKIYDEEKFQLHTALVDMRGEYKRVRE